MVRCSLLALIAAAGCAGEPPSSSPLAVPVHESAGSGPRSALAGAGPGAGPADARRWIPGDLHMHLAPLDAREGAGLTVADLARLAPAAGLEFVILTPHLHRHTWRDRERRSDWLARWQAMARDARAARGITLIPGAEYTVWGYGHFGVSGVDFGALDGPDPLAAASAAGGFVAVNHPFALPTRIPGIPLSDYDLSFRPWTDATGKAPELDGVEVWNLPLGLANLVSRPGGRTGEQLAFAAADALVRRERRALAVIGGSDNHRRQVLPTTWVLAASASEADILAALRAGASCVGSPEGGTLRARGDRDPADVWARIGEHVRADRRVDLRWSGAARLFIDGADAGVHDGGFVHDPADGAHTYRIEQGTSRCGFVYANL